MSFSRSKLLLGFVIIAALVILAGTLGAAKDVITKPEMPDFNDDLELVYWLCAHSEEILRNMRSYEPLLKEIEGYSRCLVRDGFRHQGDFWTAKKLDISAFIIYRSTEGKLLEAFVTVNVYNDDGEHIKQVHVKIDPYTFEVIGIETIEGIILRTHTNPMIPANR